MDRIDEGRRRVRLRNVPVPEAPLAALAVVAVLERRHPTRLRLPGARPLGVALGLVGAGLAAAATRAAGDVDIARSEAVVQSGPYRLTRHPMYSGWFLVYAGVVLGTGSVWGVLLAPALAAAVAVEARAEERRLLARVPDEYAAYRARVPRFVGRPGR